MGVRVAWGSNGGGSPHRAPAWEYWARRNHQSRLVNNSNTGARVNATTGVLNRHPVRGLARLPGFNAQSNNCPERHARPGIRPGKTITTTGAFNASTKGPVG